MLQPFGPGIWISDGPDAVVAGFRYPTRMAVIALDEPRVPNKFRRAFVNRRAARTDIRRIASWPAERLLAAHAPPVHSGAQALVARAFAWLRP
jgi:hypothetical protein